MIWRSLRVLQRPLVQVAFCIAAHAALLVWTAIDDSPTSLETTYVAAGVLLWETGGTSEFPQNPPLAKALLALPARLHLQIAGVPDAVPESPPRSFPSTFANELTAWLGPRVLVLVHLGRIAAVIGSILCAWLLYVAGRRLAGHRAGLCASFLWCFSGLALANGHLATADVFSAVGAALCALAAVFFAENGRISQAVLLGLSLALAVALKLTLFLLFPVGLLLVSLYPRANIRQGLLRAGAFTTAWFFGLYVFFLFSPPVLLGPEYWVPQSHLLRKVFAFQPLRILFTLLPGNLLLGIDWQAHAFEIPEGSIWLLGTLRPLPQPLYYPVAFVLKEPLGFLALLAAGLVGVLLAWPSGRLGSAQKVFVWFGFVGAAVLGAALLTNSTVCEYRYVTALLPFLVLPAALGLAVWANRWVGRAVILLGMLAVLEVLAFSPHYVAFGNLLAGGPYGLWRYLPRSAVDRGQDWYRLRRWLDAQPELDRAAVLGLPTERATLLGLSTRVSPTNRPAPVVVPVSYVTGEARYVRHPGDPEDLARWLRTLATQRPAAHPTPGTFLYYY